MASIAKKLAWSPISPTPREGNRGLPANAVGPNKRFKRRLV